MLQRIINTTTRQPALRLRLGLPIPRAYSTRPMMDEYESMIYDKLQDHFTPQVLSVRDVSGGCGSMFAIQIESTSFKGIPMVKQHRLVNELLKDEISKWHGLQLKTKAVKE